MRTMSAWPSALNDAIPGDFAEKTIFVTTGAEAVRERESRSPARATERDAVIAFTGAFHGGPSWAWR